MKEDDRHEYESLLIRQLKNSEQPRAFLKGKCLYPSANQPIYRQADKRAQSSEHDCLLLDMRLFSYSPQRFFQ
jgi:hypothetical protein